MIPHRRTGSVNKARSSPRRQWTTENKSSREPNEGCSCSETRAATRINDTFFMAATRLRRSDSGERALGRHSERAECKNECYSSRSREGRGSSSSSSYNTGLSDNYSSSDDESENAELLDIANRQQQAADQAAKLAMDAIVWETLDRSEMVRSIAERSEYNEENIRKEKSVLPGKLQLEELQERGYTLSERIGSGSYASVYIASYTDPTTNKKVDLACKICDRSCAPPDVVQKFLPREIKVLTKLNHPYVIQLHSILQQNDKMYIFMRYAENGDLLEWIQTHGVLRELHARIWFRQLVMGLDYLHTRDIVHRDLKCENVLLTRKYNIKIADFGFARYCLEDGKRSLSTTFCGSAAYAAPEVVSATPYNPKVADIWSLGIILFIMLNGTMPFDDGNLTKLLKDQIEKRWAFRARLKKLISNEGKYVVARILEPDVTQRISLERIQNTNYFKMAKETKNHSFKLFCSEFMKCLPHLYITDNPTAPTGTIDLKRYMADDDLDLGNVLDITKLQPSVEMMEYTPDDSENREIV